MLTVIFNPNNGPGAGLVDPNYVNDLGQGPLVDLLTTKTPVYGYIATGFGNRNILEVQADIDQYNNPVYWRGLNIQLAGYFIDQMSNDLEKVGYYQAVKDYINLLDSSAKVMGNPGVSSTINPSSQIQFTVDDYADSMDTIVVYEDFAANYELGYIAPAWLIGRPANAFGHIIHTTTDLQQMTEFFDLAIERNAGFLYITDDVLDNPYDQLPIFAEELWALVRHDLLFLNGFESP